MEFPWDSSLQRRYDRHQERELKEAYRIAAVLGLSLFPAFSILDWFTQREHFGQLSLIRYSVTAVFLIAHLLARRRIYPISVFVSSHFLLYVSGLSITLMCVAMDGYRNPYYAGVNLVILAAVMLHQSSFRHAVYSVGAIVASWFLAVTLKSGFRFSEPELFINNAAFILATGIIGLSCAKIIDQLKRESFLRFIQAKEVQTIRAARDMAKEALKSRDEFISIASHELKTPITSMKLQNDLMKRQIGRDEERQEREFTGPDLLRKWVERNDSQLVRLTRLVDDMLDISRINSGRLLMEPQAFSLAASVRDVLDRLGPQLIAAGIRVKTRFDPTTEGQWDRMRIEQVVINLVTNAIKYAPNGDLEISVQRRGGRALISVRDQGKGIDRENHERIFQRFERATPATSVTGLGLGLYICRKIVEGHGGRISVESTPGRGSNFKVELPLKPVGVTMVDLSPPSEASLEPATQS